MEIWFTSDSHFGHKNICKYSNRPYDSIEEHDADLIVKWNDRVKPGDQLFHLGDFAFYRTQGEIEALLAKLNGQKTLVRGNHDHKICRRAKGWHEVVDYKEIKPKINGEKQMICLFHYRMTVWNTQHHGSWALHGHSHGTLPDNPDARTFDAGVDCWNYSPINLATVAQKMAQHSFNAVDHHGRRFPAGSHD